MDSKDEGRSQEFHELNVHSQRMEEISTPNIRYLAQDYVIRTAPSYNIPVEPNQTGATSREIQSIEVSASIALRVKLACESRANEPDPGT